MSFESPLALVGLVAVPVAVWWYLRHERAARRAREAFARPELMPAVAPARPGWRRHLPFALYGLALAALVLALARPHATLALGEERAAVVLATDRSGSMQAEDIPPSRFEAAREAADRFLAAVPEDVNVAAVVFNHVAEIVQSPTTDRDAVSEALARTEPRGSTAIGEALSLSLEIVRLQADGGERPPAAIVLLSDGESVRGREPIPVAREAGREGVPIYTVALGTDEGVIEVPTRDGGTRPERVRIDRDALRRIAELSGGEAFEAEEAGELAAVYERLGSQVAREREPRELTAAFAAAALFFVVVGAALSLRWFGRFP